MNEHAAYSDEQAIHDLEQARQLRARRDAELTPQERLERLHELCRQLAAIKPATPAAR